MVSAKENGKFPAFGKEAWKTYDASRALRGLTQHVEMPNSSVEYTLTEQSLGFMIDERELEEFAMGREALMTIRTNMIQLALDLKEEYLAASQATLTGNYTAPVSGAAYDWAGAGKPVDHIVAQKEVVRGQIGLYPNTVIFSPTAWNLFRANSSVRGYLYFAPNGASAGLITEQIAAQILEVDTVRVGRMVRTNDAGTVANVWDVNQSSNVVLAYTGKGMGEPTFGMKFAKTGYPRATSYYDQARKSEAFEVQRILQHKITLAGAGQLIYSIA